MSVKIRNTIITTFVILWTFVFHYESTRHFYLNTFFEKSLPKVKLLFPPAGWIMFFNVDDGYGTVEVLGVKDDHVQTIDSHDIFRTRTIMFDNIHRNIMSAMGDIRQAKQTCRFLKMRFPYFDKFIVTAVQYPSLIQQPTLRYQQPLYQCLAKEK